MQAQTGLWVIELEYAKAPRLYADPVMESFWGGNFNAGRMLPVLV